MAELFVWQKNLLHAVRTRPVVILHGNVRDQYIFRDPPHHHEIGLDELLVRLLLPITGPLWRYDPYSKAAELSLGEAGMLVAEPSEDFGRPGFNLTTDPTIARILADMENPAQKRTWLLKYSHNMLPYRNSYSEEEGLRLIAFQRMVEHVAPDNRLLLCYLSDTQIPVELSQNSHRVAVVKVPLPDFSERVAFWRPKIDASLAEDLAKLTEGMALSSLRVLVELAGAEEDSEHLRRLTLRDWECVISHFKFGEATDYYQQITNEQLDGALRFFTVEEGIQGQDSAIKKAIRMLWMARTNVASLLRSGSSNAPRGVLFCCGPSGTGKTMLSKKLAKFVFGSEEAFHRIDMSEYQQDHTVSKLIGAPPGYVGYEMGGLLTNAMLEKPFSVVLFDEIEKAHPRIFDLFLQILSDGRLTDSRGQTVFFSEAIVVFTSNIGTRASEISQLQEAQSSNDPERVRQHFLRCVRDFFRLEISRPELLNRIGNNIVPFNYFDRKDVLVATVKFYLQSLQERFNEEYQERGLKLEVQLDDVAGFLAREYGDAIREFGGRAVLNTLDDVLLPELARCLLGIEMRPRRGPSTIHVSVGLQQGRRKVRVTL